MDYEGGSMNPTQNLVEIANNICHTGAGKYPVITTQDLQEYVKGLESNVVTRMEMLSNPMPEQALRRFGAEVQQNVATDTYHVRFTRKPEPMTIQDTTKRAIVNEVIQRGLELHYVGITEQDINDYKGIPPHHCMEKIKEAWKFGEFDDLVVIEPFQEKIEQSLIVDPIFCGKKRSEPDVYYLVTGWLKDITLGKMIYESETTFLQEAR
jgi:hypothetical protein